MPFCDLCETVYSAKGGGHCRGGKYGGCCQTFGSDRLGDLHRPVGGPCLTEAEMVERGWHKDSRGVWRGKPRPGGWG